MFRTCYVFLTLIAAELVRADCGTGDDTVRTLYRVLTRDCWSVTSDSDDPNVISVKLDEGDEGDRSRPRPLVNENNAGVVADAVYRALGCKFAETVADVLRSVLTRSGDLDGEVRRSLADVNRIALKVESGLFRLAELAPSVLAREPGELRTALSLNLRLNRLVVDPDPTTDDSGDAISGQYEETRREILAMINTAERFAIAICTTAARPWFADDDRRAGSGDPIIRYLDRLLDDAGLTESDFRTYDVKAYAPVDLKHFSVVHSVAGSFGSLLYLSVDEDLTFADFNDVFRHQKKMYNLVRLVIHRNTLAYLEELENSQNARQPTPSDSDYLGLTNIQKNNLSKIYQKLLIKAIHLRFPPDIVGHVRLMLKLVDTVLMFKYVRGLGVFIEHERGNIDFLEKNLIDTSSSTVLSELALIKLHKFELHTFLNDIISLKFVRYYNNIFELSKYDFEEVRFVEKLVDYQVSSWFNYIYASSFDIQLSINHYTMANDELIDKFMDIINLLKLILCNIVYAYPSLDITILVESDQYLRYNLIEYPKLDENNTEKLNRIVFMFTNLIDRYQITFIKFNMLRDDAYYSFKTEDNLKQYQDITFIRYLKIENTLELKSSQDILNKWVLFKYVYNGLMIAHTFLKFLWKGELKTIVAILNDVTKNLFDLYSILKYVQVFIEWMTAVVSYTTLDAIDYILVSDTNIKLEIIENVKALNINSWPKYCSVSLKTVIGRMSDWSIVDSNKSFKMIEMRSILENNLKKYSSVIQRNYNWRIQNPLSSKSFIDSIKQLGDLLSCILSLKNTIAMNIKTKKSVNPFIRYLPRYLLENV